MVEPSMTPSGLAAHLAEYSVSWTGPSQGSSGSMPIGNGDLAANIWIEASSVGVDLATGDAWDPHGRLPKIGRIRLNWPAGAFRACKQTLQLIDAAVVVEAAGIHFRAWVDAHRRVVHIEGDGTPPEVLLDPWRDRARKLADVDLHFTDRWLDPVAMADEPLCVDHAIAWWRWNRESIWGPVLRHEGLGAWAEQHVDPILHHGVAAIVWGDGFRRVGESLCHAGDRWHVRIGVVSGRFDDATQCLRRLLEMPEDISVIDHAAAWDAHRVWWHQFWSRSWIRIAGDIASWDPRPVNQGWLLQRYMSACGGRGSYPIKFNGSLFTVDTDRSPQPVDADYRMWGGAYWFQNTRLPYWPMLSSGDWECMLPLFKMYADMLPICEERARRWFGHDGAFFPETTYFFGAYLSRDYGLDRTGKQLGEPENPYIRWYWSGGLELITLGLERWAFTDDDAWFGKTVLPIARSVLRFYELHYPRDASGALHIAPAGSLETYQTEVENPLPEIAGLHLVLSRLLSALHTEITESDRRSWEAFLKVIPPLPQASDREGERLLPAAVFPATKVRNYENPELYAVFPYRHCAVGQPGLAIGRRTFWRRLHQNGGFSWRQDPIQAAYLGLAEHAWWLVQRQFAQQHGDSGSFAGAFRFPAFWGPNFDWMPDQCHGSVGLHALQSQLLQWDGHRLLVLPAWPVLLDVSFRLHAPENTVIEVVWRGGRLEHLHVDPPERAKDVELMIG